MSKSDKYVPYHKIYTEKQAEKVDVPVEETAQGEAPKDENIPEVTVSEEVPSETETPAADVVAEVPEVAIEPIQDFDSVQVAEEVKKTGVVVGCTWLNVRPDASVDNTPIFSLHSGDDVTILGEEGDFYEIKREINNVTGYVMKTYIKET